MSKDCMQFPDQATVAQVRAIYPPGTHVELVSMNDVHAPPAGTRGVVQAVDDTGSLIVAWSNGSSLHVLYGVDEVRRV